MRSFAILVVSLIAGALSVPAQSFFGENQRVPYSGKLEAPRWPARQNIPVTPNTTASTSQSSVCAIPLLNVTPPSTGDKMSVTAPGANVDNSMVHMSVRSCGEQGAKAPQFSSTPRLPGKGQAMPRMFPNTPPLFAIPKK